MSSATTSVASGSEGRPGRKSTPPRARGRENAKNTPCRNIGIYGFCKYENDGCAYNHESKPKVPTINPAGVTILPRNPQHTETTKRFNVESPSFTPLQPNSNGIAGPRPSAISPKAAQAAPFTPKSTKSSPLPSHVKPKASSPPELPEFVPQVAPTSQPLESTESLDNSMYQMDGGNAMFYDPSWALQTAMQGMGMGNQTGLVNPYLTDTGGVYTGNFYQQTNFAQPLQHHLYAPLPPYSENLLPYQRSQYDFFVPEDVRREFQKRNEALLQTLPQPSGLPNLDHFHTLVPIDSGNAKNSSLFGYQTWMYKAISSKDGQTYALRRIGGFRLSDENAIRALDPWKRLGNAGIVEMYDIFTTRKFGDASLIFVTEYHASATTLSEAAFHQHTGRHSHRDAQRKITEPTLWGYIVQLTLALGTIHSAGLAARVLHPTKILITWKNRIRLNGCGYLDVVTFPQDSLQLPTPPNPMEDLYNFGRLILALAIGHESAFNMGDPMDLLKSVPDKFSNKLKDCIRWLITPPEHLGGMKSIENLTAMISDETLKILDSNLHQSDILEGNLAQSLEDGRITRVLLKMNLILERPEHEHNHAWSDTGERYFIKLFRDYVFHAVHPNGRPNTDLSHILGCLNRLDAGTNDTIRLTSRNGETSFLVTYREIKRAIDSAFMELNYSNGTGGSKGRK